MVASYYRYNLDTRPYHVYMYNPESGHEVLEQSRSYLIHRILFTWDRDPATSTRNSFLFGSNNPSGEFVAVWGVEMRNGSSEQGWYESFPNVIMPAGQKKAISTSAVAFDAAEDYEMYIAYSEVPPGVDRQVLVVGDLGWVKRLK